MEDAEQQTAVPRIEFATAGAGGAGADREDEEQDVVVEEDQDEQEDEVNVPCSSCAANMAKLKLRKVEDLVNARRMQMHLQGGGSESDPSGQVSEIPGRQELLALIAALQEVKHATVCPNSACRFGLAWHTDATRDGACEHIECPCGTHFC